MLLWSLRSDVKVLTSVAELLCRHPTSVPLRGFFSREARPQPCYKRLPLPRPCSEVQSPRSFCSSVLRADLGMTAAMVDISDFERLRDEMTAEDELREAVIKRSRDLQKLSKQAIFSLYRQDHQQADERLSKADNILQELQKQVDKEEAGRYGALSAAKEEYAEAVIFRAFLKEGRLLSSQEISAASRDEYLGGVLDFSGELNRYAIARATVRDTHEVRRCRDLVDTLLGLFLQFDLRNGSLRKKYDALKYVLKKLENTIYELSLAEDGYKRRERDESDDDCDVAVNIDKDP